jgi:hypothetical protein
MSDKHFSSAADEVERFGRWTAVGPLVKGKYPKRSCSCACGTVRDVAVSDLLTGKSRSCGCLAREIASALRKQEAKHGATAGGRRSRAFTAWESMRRRCRDTEHKSFKWYGARGIRVCERWQGKDGFANFLADMGEPPPGMTIDRKNNSKGYDPGNCRWATQKQQQRNRRSNLLITYAGRTQTLVEWAEETGIGRQTIKTRISRSGWSIEQALSTPVVPPRERSSYGG